MYIMSSYFYKSVDEFVKDAIERPEQGIAFHMECADLNKNYG